MGTVVLADISCHSRAHACHGHGEHLANLLTGGLGGHGGAAQQVDGILHDEGTDGRNGILKAHRKADIGQPPAVPAERTQFSRVKWMPSTRVKNHQVQSRPLNSWLTTVAMAAPSTPIPSGTMNSQSSPMFRKLEISRK